METWSIVSVFVLDSFIWTCFVRRLHVEMKGCMRFHMGAKRNSHETYVPNRNISLIGEGIGFGTNVKKMRIAIREHLTFRFCLILPLQMHAIFVRCSMEFLQSEGIDTQVEMEDGLQYRLCIFCQGDLNCPK